MSPAIAEALHPWVVAFGAVMGALVGSFLNVVIARVPAGRSVVRPRSACPSCGAAIAWYDNVPIVSWVLLRARCRRCGAPISWRYPAVELLVALAAVAAVQRRGPTLATAFELAYVATLLALAFIDLDTWLLPHALTRPLLAAGLVAGILHVPPALSLARSLTGAVVGWAALWLVAWIGRVVLRKEAMGGGDVWLLAALGAWNGVAALLPILLLASLQGTIVGVALMAVGRAQPGPEPRDAGGADGEAPSAPAPGVDPAAEAADAAPPGEPDAWVPPRNAVPFGPFLVAGALEWLYFSGLLSRAVPALGLFR